MPYIKRPKKGSLAYWPKRRAKRIYPRIKNWPEAKEARPLGFAGYKVGMRHVIVTDTNPNSRTKGQLMSKPITILECPPLTVFGFRCYGDNVYDVFIEKTEKNLSRKMNIPKKPKNIEEQLKKVPQKINSINLLCHTNPVFKKKPEIFELALGGKAEEQLKNAKEFLGKQIKINEVFKEGDYIDVVSVTKGKGFAGPVKRWGVAILGRKYQQMARHTGALGQTEPGKVRWTVPQAGQLGFQTRTEFNKRILKIMDGFKVKGGFVNYGDVSENAVFIEGSVAGSKKRLIRLRVAMRPPKTKHPVDVKTISQESHQGL